MDKKIRIGTNPIAWSNDDKQELGGDTPLETCLREAREAGFTGIELGHKFPREAGKLSPILDAHDLDLISGWYSSALLERSVKEEKAALEPHLSLLESMGCKVIVWAETSGCVHGDERTPLSRRPTIDEDDWPSFAAKLSEMGAYTKSRGLQLSYHHHMGTVIETGAEVDRLMSETSDDVGLLLDTGHLTFAGADPRAAAVRHGRRITHVHCKDVRQRTRDNAVANDMSFLDSVVAGVFTVPGDGNVDFESVLGALADSGYRGWLVVEAEQDPARANPLEYARIGYKTLASLTVEAGLADHC